MPASHGRPTMTTNTATSVTKTMPTRRRGKRDDTNATVAPIAAAPRPAPTLPTTAKALSKSATVLKLLTRARGATAAEIGEPTGWQPHSVRAYLSGLRKKGMAVVREQRRTGETSYRIVEGAQAVPVNAAAAAPVVTGIDSDQAAADRPEVEAEAIADAAAAA